MAPKNKILDPRITKEEIIAIRRAGGEYWKLVNQLRAKGKLAKSMEVKIDDDCNDEELLNLKKLQTTYLKLKYRGKLQADNSRVRSMFPDDTDEDEEVKAAADKEPIIQKTENDDAKASG